MTEKIVLVTGATRGIGKEILYGFAENGYIVYGIYASSKIKANTIELDANEKGYKVKLFQGDVTDRTFYENLVEQIVKKHHRIDVLVNNAGITKDNMIINMSESDWTSVIDVNFGGTLNGIAVTIPHMLKQRNGNIINVVSVSGVRGREAQCNYGTSKGAIIGLTRMLSRKYGKDGLRFNCVAPGMIATDMINQVPQYKLDNFLKFTSLKRLGEAHEVAKTVVYLANEESSYMSNSVIQLDGGFIR